MTNNKTTIYWVTVFILQVLFIAWYKGMLTSDSVAPLPLPSDSLVMTAMEAKLTKNAIEMIRSDVADGKISSADIALMALSAELPESARDRVMKALGQPGISFMRDALDILEGKIEVKR